MVRSTLEIEDIRKEALPNSLYVRFARPLLATLKTQPLASEAFNVTLDTLK